MGPTAASWRRMPLMGRCMLGGGALFGGLGSVTGLVVGLVVHAGTAWAAVVEGGVGAGLVGLVLGAALGGPLLGRRAWVAHRGLAAGRARGT